jgi:hypothetical protein
MSLTVSLSDFMDLIKKLGVREEEVRILNEELAAARTVVKMAQNETAVWKASNAATYDRCQALDDRLETANQSIVQLRHERAELTAANDELHERAHALRDKLAAAKADLQWFVRIEDVGAYQSAVAVAVRDYTNIPAAAAFAEHPAWDDAPLGPFSQLHAELFAQHLRIAGATVSLSQE